jgi:hypothetical protein
MCWGAEDVKTTAKGTTIAKSAKKPTKAKGNKPKSRKAVTV